MDVAARGRGTQMKPLLLNSGIIGKEVSGDNIAKDPLGAAAFKLAASTECSSEKNETVVR